MRPTDHLTGIVGYHVYAAVPTAENTDGISPPTQRELVSYCEVPIVLPIARPLENLSPPLPPGKYVLVPIGEGGLELPHVPIIEKALPDTAALALYRSALAESFETAQTVTSVLENLVQQSMRPTAGGEIERAHAVAVYEVFFGQNWEELVAQVRVATIVALGGAAFDAFQITGIDASSTFPLDQESFEYIRSRPGLQHLHRIRTAIHHSEYDDAAIRVLARAGSGLETPSELVADVLRGIDEPLVFLALAKQMIGSSGEPLLDLLRRERLAADSTGDSAKAWAAFAIWQINPAAAMTAILPQLRQLARLTQGSFRTVGLVGWLAAQMGDEHLLNIHKELFPAIWGNMLPEAIGSLMCSLWKQPLAVFIAGLPERDADSVPARIPVRAASKVGPNERCPCGSGLKYKKCCADKPAVEEPRPARSRAKHPQLLGGQLKAASVEEMSRAGLAVLDLRRLREAPLRAVMHRQAKLHDWKRASAALEELGKRGGPDSREDDLQELAYEALSARHYHVAQHFLLQLGPADVAADLALEVALAIGDPETLRSIETLAGSILRDEAAVSEAELAFATLHTMPALGILIARGALFSEDMLSDEVLLNEIEEARDRLLLPPGDRAQEIFDALGGVREKKAFKEFAEAERSKLTQVTTELRADLDEATSRVAALQRQIASVESRERATGSSLVPVKRSEQAELDQRSLRQKIDELQGQIREGNAERSELRAELLRATERTAQADQVFHASSNDFDKGMENLASSAGTRPVLLPRFSATAVVALEAVPRSVAANAMRTIGFLAGGDVAGWRGVKQAQAMPRQLLMVRIGIHHRLLFRADDGALEILDLVTRESLQATLKHMRAS